MSTPKIILITIGSFILFTLVWFFVLNVGRVDIYAQVPFDVVFEGYRKFECRVYPCSLQSKSGSYTAYFSKSGYYDVEMNVDVPRLSSSEVGFNFVLVPDVVNVDADDIRNQVSPLVVPDALKAYQQSVVYRSETEDAYYYNTDTQEVLHWFTTGQQVSIATLSVDVTDALIVSPSEKYLFVVSDSTLYSINLSNKRKNRVVLDYKPEGEIILLGDELIAYQNTNNDIVVLSLDGEVSHNIDFRDPLVFLEWANEDQLLFATSDRFGFINIKNGEMSALMSNLFIDNNEPLILDKDQRSFEYINTSGQGKRIEF